MPEGTIAWEAWTLTAQSVIDVCADALFDAGFPTHVSRNPDPGDNTPRFMQINLPDDPGHPLKAALGQVVVLLFGKPQVLTPEEYAQTFPAA